MMARNSLYVRTKSAFPSIFWSTTSDFFAIHGPINTVTASESFDLIILEVAHIGDTVVEILSVISGK